MASSFASRMWCSGGHQLPMSSVNTVNARSIGASTTTDDRTGGLFSCIGLSLSLLAIAVLLIALLDRGLEAGQGVVPEPVEIGPQRRDPIGVQAIDPPAAVPVARDQSRVLQHLEVLR